jgi:ketosteroid isomerase-like protein
MNRRQVCAVLIVVLLVAGAARASDKKSVDSLLAADAGWMKVFSAKDLDKSVGYCEQDGSVLGPNAPIATGREAITKMFSGFFALPNLDITWQANKADVARSGELGYTSGTYRMTFSDPSGKTVSDKGKYVTVWEKQKDGSWKVGLDIFNTDLPPAGAP